MGNNAITLEEWERRLAANPDYAIVERQMRPYLNIAHAILVARVKAGLTQTDLAQMAGLTQDKISRIESAIGNPRLATLQKIADALEISLTIEPRQRRKQP